MKEWNVVVSMYKDDKNNAGPCPRPKQGGSYSFWDHTVSLSRLTPGYPIREFELWMVALA